jgi:hypothetical protein
MTQSRRRTALLALSCLGLAACGSSHPLADTQPDAGGPAQEDAGDPNQPPAGFLDPAGASYVTLRFKGLINSSDTVFDDSSNIITGIGQLTSKVGDQTLALSDSDGMYAYDYSYPDGRYLFASGRRASADSTSTRGRMQDASVYFLAAKAEALQADSHLIVDASSSVRDIEYVVRKDQSVLYKVCYQGLADSGAQVFLDHTANQSFAVGESLVLWANVPLVTDPQTILQRCTTCTSYQGAACRCQVDDASFDCADWETAAADDGSELSCGPPEGFLTPPASGDWATFKFKGRIAAETEESPAPGYADATIAVGGTTVTASQFGYATEYDPGQDSNLLAVSFYDQQADSSGVVRIVELDFYVAPAALVAAQGAGTNPIVMDERTAAMGLAQRITAYPSGGSYSYRVCPFAVFRPGETAGRVFDCPAANTTFGAGERLEIEGSLVVETDVTADDVGAPLEASGCYCGNDQGYVACSTLPQ